MRKGIVLVRRIMRFVASGGLAALTEYALYLVLFFGIGLHVVPAQAISFFGGLIVSYLMNKFWVFRDTRRAEYKKEFILFVLLGGTNLVVTSILIQVLVEGLNVYAPFAKFVLMACVAIWNYIIFQKIIFRKKTS